MKKIICFLPVFLMLMMPVLAQELSGDKIPPKVKAAFDKKYANVTEVKFIQEKRNVRVSFKDQETPKSALFSSTGSWIETATPVNESDFPKKVAKSVSKNFEGFEKSNFCSLETPQLPLSYRFEARNDKQAWEVQIGVKGDVIRKLPLKIEKPKK